MKLQERQPLTDRQRNTLREEHDRDFGGRCRRPVKCGLINGKASDAETREKDRPNTATASRAFAIEAAAGSSVLLARSAGVHVDFHADRHFHDLRSFPSHSGSPKVLSATSRGAKPRAASCTAQAWNRSANTANCRIALANFPLGQITFAPSQAPRLSPQQSQQSAAGARVQLLRIQRSVLVGIRCVEALLHHGQIFLERESAIVIGIGGGEFFRR